MARTALITGIRGQDGAYLAQFLLNKGYTVVGADRRSGETTHWRLRRLGIGSAVRIVYCDLQEYSNVLRTLQDVQPDEIYNLAAQSFVKASFDQPIVTTQANSLGVLHLLEAIRTVNPRIKFYQASTSEMFGKVRETPQTELTPFHPRSPYGVSKLYGHFISVNYRESYDMFACCGLLFNHESPLRGSEFVTRKIALSVAAIARGQEEKLVLGNMDAKRDWGYAPEYVEGMWMMLQQPSADDYVLATGTTHSVREFVNHAFETIDLPLTWEGSGADERGRDPKGVVRVAISPEFYRPAEVDYLVGDASKARTQLGWTSRTPFAHLVEIMVRADLDAKPGE
ncbi:MAG TPA: GDP-mannose 4,6-dehydratase [Polyangiales bacterium]|nr:GDP-mannose 4,6-dehydratase [Polyangiales bacterium]